MTQKIFGIDLGTTNSCLAVMEAGGPRVIAIDGEPIVPSVVSLDRQTGRFLVGRRARNRQVAEPAWTVRSIKRRMGEPAPVRLGDRELLPAEVSAEILRHLKERGEEALGAPVTRAVITVPAYFGDAERRATIQAGELAGLEVVRLLNEPTAAALVYDRLVARQIAPRALRMVPDGPDGAPAAGGRSANESENPQRILVYDLGGGTFDVSVVEIGGGLNEVRASGGNNRLGGDDFDRLLAEHLAVHLRERSGRELPRDLRLAARLEDAAERAKIDLSSRPFARVIEEALLGTFHLDLEVARQSFEELIESLLASTLAEVDRTLAEARLPADQIDRVVLVGGSTHIPRVQELLAGRFSCPVEHAVDPALCVALGAAVQGAILAGEVFDHILVDVAAHSLGVKTMDNVRASGLWGSRTADHFSTVIRRNTQVPATRSELYYTVMDDQELVAVEVYQGESPRCSENTLIGEFPFPLLPAPENSPVLVEFRYDLDGIIRVAVHQKGTDNRKEVTLSTRTREEAQAGAAGPVENYILRKARALAASHPEGAFRERLGAAAGAYEEILADPAADPGAVDRAEEELLEVLNEAEEAAPVVR
jgi:molecular chaperone DnaK